MEKQLKKTQPLSGVIPDFSKPISTPNPFLVAMMDILVLRKDQEELKKKGIFEIKVQDMFTSLGRNLLTRIPITETNILTILKTSCAFPPKSIRTTFLEHILLDLFDRKTFSFGTEFVWYIPIVAIPFVIDYENIRKEFETLNSFWGGIINIEVDRTDSLYIFSITRLS